MNFYTLENVILGTWYRGTRGSGEIVEATERQDTCCADGRVFAVRVRPTYDGTLLRSDFWATIVVGE